MKTLVLYDSAYGNTARAATSIGAAISGDVQVMPLRQCDPNVLRQVDLLVVGSPTQNRKPTAAMRDFLDSLPESALQGKQVAAFDTRYAGRLVAMFSAAKKIAERLEAKGALLAAPPEGFLVSHKEGPLKPGELERAARWASDTAARVAAAAKAPRAA